MSTTPGKGMPFLPQKDESEPSDASRLSSAPGAEQPRLSGTTQTRTPSTTIQATSSSSVGGVTWPPIGVPEPYYQDESVVILHGDCREILPYTGPVDVVLTDPPYGIEGGRGLGKTRGRGNYTTEFTDNPANIEATVVPIVKSLILRVACVVVTPGNRCLSLYPAAQSFGCFFQPAAVGLQTFGNLDAQPILYYGKNASGRVMGTPCSYRLTESPEKNGHPCPKPLRAWRLLLSNISLPAHTVLDPFMGSGTTLRAAKDLGRKAIGIEIEERYCEIAAKRMAQEVLAL